MEFTTIIVTGQRYNQVFIPFNVPSSKNSRQFNIQQRRSFHSPAYQKYVKNTKKYWSNPENMVNFRRLLNLKQDPPYIIYFYFIRDSKRKFDWHNAIQGPLDLMAQYNWIDDDNASIMVPAPIKFDGAYYKVDTVNPGVYIIF